MTDGTLTLNDAMRLLSPDGQQFIVDLIRRARSERGSQWIAAIEEQFPTAAWMVDLVANHDADTTVASIAAEYGQTVRLFTGQIKTLHARLREEIDKPR